MKYKDYNDNELLMYICEGNEDASEIMIKKYEPFINKLALKLSQNIEYSGIDYMDLKQEGIVGLYNAINTFMEHGGTKFNTFALTCIKRRMYNCTKRAHSTRNKALNEGMLFGLDVYEKCFIDDVICSDHTYNPERIIIEKVDKKLVMDKIMKCLTELEKKILSLKIDGYSYREIAEKTSKKPKNVDNTLQRIKNKVQKCLQE